MTYPIQADGIDGITPRGGSDALSVCSQQETRRITHISVCVCTFKRPQLLQRLLGELASQETNGLFTYSVVIVDNDTSRSAESVASEFAQSSSTPVRYVAEPSQNIALARNKAVENADGDFIGFIDDDEFPTRSWLLTLLQACNQYKVDGVLGPVKRHFDEQPPQWLLKTNFYERPTYPTGFVIDWRKGRTGNVLLRKEVLAAAGREPFNPEFRTGEDQEFFSRMIQRGYVFIWCDEAVAYEVVPPLRWKKTFMLRRALLRGAMEPKTPNFGMRDVVRSLVAVCVYTAALPFAFVLGQHRFMTVLVSACDHLGKLLAVAGINPVKEQYVTE
jgi:succinoglycan biosynthesis protein ExoM